MEVVVVTGAAGGVGAVIARALRADHEVVVVDVRPPEIAHPRVHPIVGDAGDPFVADLAIERAEALGRLTGWVNNAAVFRDLWIDEADPLDVVAQIEANLRPAVVGSATAVRAFRRSGEGGSIVNVGSHQGARPVRGNLAYATGKAAVEGLTRALAVDHGPDGIRVNAVALGSVRTERYDAELARRGPDGAAAFEAAIGRVHPLGRIGEPGEVGAVVRFLLSPEASFVSGAIIPVDGGRSARGDDPEERSR